jgi:hypothetical protein
METTTKIMALATTGASLLALLAAPSVSAQSSKQTTKNNMRNIGIAAGALAGQQLLKGKGANALILGAGAAYAGKKYEDTRKEQSQKHHHHW